MRPIITFLIVMAFVFGSPQAALSQNAEQLYQKGLMKEEGEGNLSEAINIYNSIVENQNAEQSIQAKALLHVGLCYEKLGKQEATKAYQSLVNNFPSQKNEVAIARERLSKLILAVENNEQKKEKKVLSVRKVLADAPSEPLGAPSPDGRYISFVDWASNSNLSILDLNTNEKKCITDFKNDGEQAYYSSWSHDGKKLAFFWWEMGDNEDRYNVSVVDVTGNNQKKLYTSNQVNWIELGNWSSDGKYILATLSVRDHPESQIVRISTSDGSVEILKTFANSYLGGKPLYSPDNRFVAYDLPDEKASGNSDIYILSIEDKSDNPLFKHPAHDNILGWTPEGNNILFASDRSGSVDAMIIPVQEGKSTGKPILVKSNIGRIVPMGFTQKGSFYYGEWPDEQNIYSAEIDFEKGKVITKPTLAIKRFEGKNGSPYYSNDGKFLAYISRRGIIERGKPGIVLCIRELETGKEIEISPPIEISNTISHPTWSPDDSSIALMLRAGGNQSIYIYNLQTKKYSPLVPDPDKQSHGVDFIYPQWSPDGKTVYYFQLSPNSQTSYIKARNIETGKDKEIFQYSSDDFMDRIFTIKISPDGKWISAINRGKKRTIKLISTNGGETKDLVNFILPGGNSLPQFWSNDGKYIIYAFNTENGKWNLKRIPIEGGEQSEIEINILGINSPNLHPDGRQLIFSSLGFSFPKNNIWVMENFLPSENQETASKEPEGIVIKQLPDIWQEEYGSPSPDAKFFSYMDGETGNLAIRNFITEKSKILTTEGTWDGPLQFANFSKISPDDKRVAYSWQYTDNGNKFDLRVLNIDNPSPHILYKMEEGEVHPAFWLSDNKRLIAYRINTKNNTYQIISVNTDDGSFKVLNTSKKLNGIPGLCLSSDEKYIAFDFLNGTNKNFDIYSIPVEGGPEVRLIEHPANDRTLGWLPGRKELLFLSDRSGTWDIWSLPILKGKPNGQPKLIFSDAGEIKPVEITCDGTLYFSRFGRKFTITIYPFDTSDDKINNKFGIPLLGSNYNAEWSPDGQSIAYNKEIMETVGNANKLYIYDFNTGKERPVAENLEVMHPVSWSPKENTILTIGLDIKKTGDKNYLGGIYTIEVKTGKETKLLSLTRDSFKDLRQAFNMAVEWSMDAKSFFYIKENRIVQFEMETGQLGTLYTAQNSLRFLDRFSKGNELVFMEGKQIMKVSGENGDIKKLSSLEDGQRIGSLFWSPDGNNIYLYVDGWLCKLPSDGGTIQKVCPLGKETRFVSIHSDGKKIAITKYAQKAGFLVMENLAQEIDKIYSQNE